MIGPKSTTCNPFCVTSEMKALRFSGLVLQEGPARQLVANIPLPRTSFQRTTKFVPFCSSSSSVSAREASTCRNASAQTRGICLSKKSFPSCTSKRTLLLSIFRMRSFPPPVLVIVPRAPERRSITVSVPEATSITALVSAISDSSRIKESSAKEGNATQSDAATANLEKLFMVDTILPAYPLHATTTP